VRPLLELSGENGIAITPEMINTGWGDHFAKKKVVMVEEVYQPDNKSFFNGLQVRLGNTGIEKLNMKGQAMVNQQNLYSMYLFSNHENAMHLPRDNDKLLVVRGPDSKLSPEIYAQVGSQVEGAGPLLAHIKHFLLTRDVSAFSHAVLPVRTEALNEMSLEGMGEAARKAYDWATERREVRSKDGHTTLVDFRPGRACVRAEELRQALIAWHYAPKGRQPADGLEAAGWVQIRGTKKVGGQVIVMPRGVWVPPESAVVTMQRRQQYDWFAHIDPEWAANAER
jgi:hypothetical protein